MKKLLKKNFSFCAFWAFTDRFAKYAWPFVTTQHEWVNNFLGFIWKNINENCLNKNNNIFQMTRFNHTMTFFKLEKGHSMIETRRLKNVVIFVQTILSFVLSRKIINENIVKLV